MKDNRPLSPHLQVYRPQITSVLSILHRLTGLGLVFGALLLTVFLVASAQGPDSFNTLFRFLDAPFGKLLMLGLTWALFYHLLNGLRHLWWDTGRGIDMPSVRISGWLVVAGSFLLTVLAWLMPTSA